LYDLVGDKLAAMGHTVQSIDGEDVGGVQSIMFVDLGGGTPPVNGYYRAGSDFRKDGQAAGW